MPKKQSFHVTIISFGKCYELKSYEARNPSDVIDENFLWYNFHLPQIINWGKKKSFGHVKAENSAFPSCSILIDIFLLFLATTTLRMNL